MNSDRTVMERRNTPESPFMKMAWGGGSRKYSTVEHLRVPFVMDFAVMWGR